MYIYGSAAFIVGFGSVLALLVHITPVHVAQSQLAAESSSGTSPSISPSSAQGADTTGVSTSMEIPARTEPQSRSSRQPAQPVQPSNANKEQPAAPTESSDSPEEPQTTEDAGPSEPEPIIPVEPSEPQIPISPEIEIDTPILELQLNLNDGN